jgi:hypothetical protein
MRTMVAWLLVAALPGTFMNSPGSMCRAWPAVENGGRSASRVRCR